MNRTEHLQWCKDRALKYVAAGDNKQAVASMAGDLDKHPETNSSSGMCWSLGLSSLMAGGLATEDQGEKFINGFN